MGITVPNWVTLIRLVLAVVFVLLALEFDGRTFAQTRWAAVAAFFTFVVAAASDYLDGWLARRLGQTSTLGRILDPFVDKILVCSAFVLFLGDNFRAVAGAANFVAPWMVVAIVGRELLVSSIRAQSESNGAGFAAAWVGKVKMVVQSFAASTVLGSLAFRAAWIESLVFPSIAAAVAITLYSLVTYLWRARNLLFSSEAIGPSTGPRIAAVPGVERSRPTGVASDTRRVRTREVAS